MLDLKQFNQKANGKSAFEPTDKFRGDFSATLIACNEVAQTPEEAEKKIQRYVLHLRRTGVTDKMVYHWFRFSYGDDDAIQRSTKFVVRLARDIQASAGKKVDDSEITASEALDIINSLINSTVSVNQHIKDGAESALECSFLSA